MSARAAPGSAVQTSSRLRYSLGALRKGQSGSVRSRATASLELCPRSPSPAQKPVVGQDGPRASRGVQGRRCVTRRDGLLRMAERRARGRCSCRAMTRRAPCGSVASRTRVALRLGQCRAAQRLALALAPGWLRDDFGKLPQDRRSLAPGVASPRASSRSARARPCRRRCSGHVAAKSTRRCASVRSAARVSASARLGELGGRGGGTAGVSLLRRILERRGDRLRSGSSVASARCRARCSPVGDETSESCVQCQTLRPCQAPGHRRPEQRVGEAEPLAVELEDPGLERLGRGPLRTGADDRLDELDASVRRPRPRPARPRSRGARGCRGGCAAGASRLVGTGSSSPERQRAASTLECGGELEREERIPARCLPDADERRPRKRRVQARAEQLVRRAEAESADLDRCGAVRPATAAQQPLRR